VESCAPPYSRFAIKYDPRIHHRRSIRLQGYDYSQSGAYFVTICTHDRALILITDAVREVVQSTWDDLPNRFAHVSLDEFVIMPNHVHGIVIFTGPDTGTTGRPGLGAVVSALKSISANAANRLLARTGQPFWQRNYYEHIIRSERKLNQLRQYIRDNPARWTDDPDNPESRRRCATTVRRAVGPSFHRPKLERGKPTPLPDKEANRHSASRRSDNRSRLRQEQSRGSR
jgi:REP element-mobilizing transposase RayT